MFSRKEYAKLSSGGTETFQRDRVGVTAPVLTDGTATFTASGENRGGVKTSSSFALKNTDLQTNSAGSVTAERQNDAFGNVIASTGAWKSQFGNAGRFGYQEDADSGLKLLGHRYYDSSTGRLLTRDPIKDGRNWYGYCGGNPIDRFDSSGLWFETVLDIISLILSVKDYLDNPSAESAAWIAADLAGVLLPVPSAGILRHGRKFLKPAEDAIDAGKGIGKLDSTPSPEIKPGSSGAQVQVSLFRRKQRMR